MARECERQFVGGNTVTIVADADEADAAFLQVNLDPARAGIEGVLDQFLDHGRWPFDDFAGGDLVDQGVGELLDFHGKVLHGIDDSRPPPDYGACFLASRCRRWPRSVLRETPDQGLPPAPRDAVAFNAASARAAYSVPGGGCRVK